jgi:hypothetical protein
MLAKLAPRFVISRVIQTSYYAEFMAVELTKQIIGESAISFYFDDPKKYYVCPYSSRNAIFTGICPLCPHPLSLPISFKPKNTRKLSINWHSTTMFEPSMKSWINMRLNWENFIVGSRQATQAPTSSPVQIKPMR